jgi:hypothetical protein
MITTILNSKNEKITFTTQQYQVGLYLIINNDPLHKWDYQ